MGKKDNFNILVKILSKGLCHKIGSMVNQNAIYAQKYSKEADNFFNLARNISLKEHWNLSDKQKIKIGLKNKLKQELESRSFLDNKKYDLIDKEIDIILKEFMLD